jgi:DNA-binding CsgD family transcriptional regulator
LDKLLDAVRGGESRALVLHGEAGVGKTALLEHAVERASGFRVVRAAGVQSEMELPFAGLHQLCGPLLDQLPRLPGPQRDALGTAFGLIAGSAADHFFVGLAVLSLLSEVAEEQPLLCVVDDSQWLDEASAQALAFVARRLGTESVALLFAVREPGEELAPLPKLLVEGLRASEARALLSTLLRWPLDERVRDRIVAETHGNPLALLELPSGLTPAELAGGFGLPVAMPLSGRIEESFRRRLVQLPADARRLLLVAAAEPVGDPVLLWRAAQRLGLSFEAGGCAEAAGLLEFGARVVFRHPLVRSAAYQAASPQDRREAHAALAEAVDPKVDPDRRVWHQAHATSGPAEDIASELERSAGRARARGGVAAAAAFLEQAAALTPDPTRRANRALAAAGAKLQVGAFDGALTMLGIAEVGPLDELDRARVDLLRAQLAFVANRGNDAPLLLLKAAGQLERLDVGLARETYLDALSAAMFAGRLAGPGGDAVEVSRAARAAPALPRAPRVPDLLLDGLAALFSEGYSAGVPILRRALTAFGTDMSPAEELRWLWLACVSALHLWDDERWDVLSERHVELARGAGVLSELPLALSSRVYMHLFAGDLTAASSLVEEVQAVTEATGSNLAPYGAVGLAALRGHEAETSALIDASIREVVRRGEGIGISVTEWARAVLYNGLGRYGNALGAAQHVTEHPDDLGSSNWGMVELIEAAALGGTPEIAADAHRRLVAMAQVSGTDWALGVAARSSALLADSEAAGGLYQEAVARLGRTRLRPDLARAHLLYGEWLRRRHRRGEAREHLEAAHAMFRSLGTESFEDRASGGLLAVGARAKRRTPETSDKLTAQEAQIAQLARDGLSNPEISARLFISRRTVEYHLHKIFDKLGIGSRSQLARALSNDRSPAA